MQLIIISSFFLDAYAFSTEGIIGFSLGKKSKKMFLTTVYNSILLSFFTGIIISIFYLFFAIEIINLLTDLEYLRYLIYKYVMWVIFIPPIASFCYQLDGIFIGATQTKEMRNAMIVSVVLFITISLFLIEKLNNYGVWFSLFIFMILRASTLHFYFNKIKQKFK